MIGPSTALLEAPPAQPLDEELRQLAGAGRQALGGRAARGVGHQPGVLVLDHPGAGARRHHHVLGAVEEADGAARDRRRLGMVTGVEQRQPAARLARRELHGHAQPAQQAHDPLAHLGVEHVPQAGDHEGRAERRTHACGGGGETSTSSSSRAPESLTTPCASARRRDDGLAGLQRLVAAADAEASAALQHDVDLVLLVVGVDLLGLARLQRSRDRAGRAGWPPARSWPSCRPGTSRARADGSS